MLARRTFGLKAVGVRRAGSGREGKPHLIIVQSRHRVCASSGWEAASSLYTAVESAR